MTISIQVEGAIASITESSITLNVSKKTTLFYNLDYTYILTICYIRIISVYLLKYCDPQLGRSSIHKSRINREHKPIEDIDLTPAQTLADII